jgi:hypothetical protein
MITEIFTGMWLNKLQYRERIGTESKTNTKTPEQSKILYFLLGAGAKVLAGG